MSNFRLIWRVMKPPTYILKKELSQNVVSRRFAGNYQRTQKNVMSGSQLASIRERLQQIVHPLSGTEWKELRKEVLNSSSQISEVNVDATVLGLCNPDTQLRVAESYLDFLRAEGETPNYATIGRVLRMYYPAHQKNQLSDQDQQNILEIYRKFRQEHEILDQTTCESLIAALIVTPEWKESLQLLDMIKVTSVPAVTAYSVVITRAFQNKDDMEIGWSLLKEMCEAGKQPRCEVFIQYLDTINTDPKSSFLDNLNKILEFIGEYNIVVSRTVIDKLQDIANTFDLASKIARLAKNGRCTICGQHQSDISISTKEFLNLSASFMDKVLIRKDVFLKSSPDEVDRFMRFMDRTGSYDCVIDGLNVAYSTGLNKHYSVYAKTLASVVKYFKTKGRNILVLGRQHMNKWPQEPMNYIKQNANLFLTANLSQDDPFLLYATIKSGPKADFVSRDLMRSHAFLLGPELKQIFRRWQQQHQYMVVLANDQGKVAIKTPIQYNLNAAKINSTWHVPFKEVYSASPSESYEVPELWLCLSIS